MKDSEHINRSESNEIYYWSKKFKCKPSQLFLAIEKVGNKVCDVEAFIKDLKVNSSTEEE